MRARRDDSVVAIGVRGRRRSVAGGEKSGVEALRATRGLAMEFEAGGKSRSTQSQGGRARAQRGKEACGEGASTGSAVVRRTWMAAEFSSNKQRWRVTGRREVDRPGTRADGRVLKVVGTVERLMAGCCGLLVPLFTAPRNADRRLPWMRAGCDQTLRSRGQALNERRQTD